MLYTLIANVHKMGKTTEDQHLLCYHWAATCLAEYTSVAVVCPQDERKVL